MEKTLPEINLRAPEPADVDFMYILENERDVASAGFGLQPLSRKMLHDYVAAYDGDLFSAKELRLIVVDAATGAAVGVVDIADFNPHDRRGFAGIAVAQQYRRQGYALAALQALCALASELGMHQLAAVIAYDNAPSRALFAAAGFTQCGQLRSWIRRGESYRDAAILQKLLIPAPSRKIL